MPQPPEDVRLVDPLGNEWPCELEYNGEYEGIHSWIATPTHMSIKYDQGWTVKIRLLPSKTSVVFGVDDD